MMTTSMKNTLLPLLLLFVAARISIASSSEEVSKSGTKIDGKVLELDESNFESTISSFDYVFVDFYAPWCGHCQRLSPELDAAAPILAQYKQPLVIAKVNAEKYKRLAKKYELDGYPMLKIFMHGVPVDYYGPRKADLLVRYLRKFVAPDVAILDSDSAITDFVKEAGTYFPIFIGFGLNEAIISSLAIKYKKKAWFSVAKDFSDNVMVDYDFDKFPVLISVHPNYNEQSIFYGPFEEEFLEDFIKQNFLPPVVPINQDTLNMLKDDERKIVLAIMDDESEERSQKLIKLLKSASVANRDLVFGYVGVKQWGDFAETFGANDKLPKMVVWDGDEEYITVIGSESIGEEEQGSQISQFLVGYKEGRIEKRRISGPSLMGFINSLIGTRAVYIIVFVVAMLMLIQSINKEEPLRVGTRDQTAAGASSSEDDEISEHRDGKKDD